MRLHSAPVVVRRIAELVLWAFWIAHSPGYCGLGRTEHARSARLPAQHEMSPLFRTEGPEIQPCERGVVRFIAHYSKTRYTQTPDTCNPKKSNAKKRKPYTESKTEKETQI